MKDFLLFLLTIGCAYLGAKIAEKLKFPTPYMLGPMLATAALNILFKQTFMPSFSKQIAQSISGTYIALQLSKKDIKGLKQLIAPALILVGCFLCFTAIMGFTLHFIFKLNLASSFLVSIPGGVSEIALMAGEFGAEPSTVSFIQTFRAFTVLIIFPALITNMKKKYNFEDDSMELVIEEEEYKESILDRLIPQNDALQQIITLIIGLIGGWIGKVSGLPAGTLSFAMIAVLILHLNSKRAKFDRKYRKYVQMVSGTLIGKTMTLELVLNVPFLFLPTIVLMAGYVLANLIISWLMSKTRKIDFISGMFASSPGGASDMALIANELGGNSPKIAVLQIFRLLSVYILFPIWAEFLIKTFVK